MICLIPIGLVLLLAILLYIPSIQQFAVKKAVRVASEASGMQIGLERIRLSFPLDLRVEGIEVLTAPTDTLLTLDEIGIRVNPLPLMRQIVSIESIHLKEAKIQTGSFMEGMEINGYIHELGAAADYIYLTEERATLNRLTLSGADLHLRIDSLSQEEDTTAVPMNWKIRLGDISLAKTALALTMPTDSIALNLYVDQALARKGEVDLGLSRYSLAQFLLSNTDIRFDRNEEEPLAGLDPNHLVITQLNTDIRSLFYQEKEMAADIRSFTLTERSGLAVTSAEGAIESDSLYILIPELTLATGASSARLAARIPWSLMAEVPSETDSLQASLTFSLGKKDLFRVAPDLPTDFQKAWPDEPLKMIAWGEGTLESLAIQQVIAELPGALALSGAGSVGHVMDSVRRSATFQFDAMTEDLDFILAYLPANERSAYHIPAGMTLRGEASLANQQVQTALNWTDQEAEIALNAAYHLSAEAYQADLQVKNLEPIRYLPTDSILWVDATLKAEGAGTDFYSPATWADISATVDSIQYMKTSLSAIELTASLKESQAHAEMKSENPNLKAHLMIDGALTREQVSGMVILDADKIDLYRLHLMDSTFNTNFNLFAEWKSDWKEQNQADVTLGNWDIQTPDIRLRRQLLTLKARSDEDTTQVSLHAGDLGIVLTGNAGLNALMNQFTTITDELNRQLVVDSMVNIAALRPSFPDMDLTVSAKRDNPVYSLLRRSYISYTDLDLHASTSPEEGITMDASLYAFAQDTFLIDTIRAKIRPDSTGLLFGVNVIKNRYRQQLPFTAGLKGSLHNQQVEAELTFANQHKETGLQLGVRATKENEGYTFSLFPEQPIIAYNTFQLNADNLIRFRNMQDIEANVRLTGKENASFWIHSEASEGAYSEVMAEIGHLNLAHLSKGLDLIPDMAGLLSANIRYAPDGESFMVVADAFVDDLYYEKGQVGEMMMNAVYLPLENAQHQVDVHLYHERAEIGSAYALLQTARQTTHLDGALNITELPLPMFNPFIPENMAEMEGRMNGEITIAGSTDKPVLNGFLQLDSSSVYLGMADTRLRFDNKKITVEKSMINLNKYNIYSAGNNPFVINGHIDISNFSRMMADLKMTANNMQVLDAKRTKESLVYGRLLMNFDTTIKGPLTGLVVRGDAHLLGGTDLTYVLTDSPLSVQDRMDGLVTFTSFTDTLTRERRSQGPTGVSGMDLLMVLHIDPTVQVQVDLNPDQSNYVRVEGGGDLTFQMNKQGDMVLNGRYTLSEGVVKYSLPVVPLKEFNIHQGSSVQWDGEIMNPMIDLVATERMRATVTRDGNQRKSNFDVGISIQERLENMSMSFVLDAVDDQRSMSELAALGEDERTRWAVYMMITGQYMGADNSTGVNVDAVISNFLMGEVNNIAGDVLKGVDINLGLDTYESEGQTQRDLTFSFSKRFYNDRIRVTVGGKVAMENQQQAESFLDNFAAEYLLDPAGSKTVKFFYDRNYDMLEGEVVQTGVGIVLRKKVLRLRELFDFRKKKIEPIEEEPAEQIAVEGKASEEPTDVEPIKTSEDETTE